MKTNHSFTVYNAAAGAGKTYTLVKEYLIKLFTGTYKDNYKNILAITFTNKAVGEMKSRILENLKGISEPVISEKYQAIFNDIQKETGEDEIVLKNKATSILKSILHNYAAFDVVTIDTFTHRVIRTFAHDLGIPMNFEIEMDTDSLLQEAVDSLINKAGIDKDLTKIIIDFAFNKLDDDKSWDITLELNKTAKLLLSENERFFIQKLSGKTKQDFEKLKQKLKKTEVTSTAYIIDESKKILELLDSNGLQKGDFTRGSIPTHFKKLSEGELLTDFTAAWKQNIETTPFYNAKLENGKKESIDGIRNQIENTFLKTKEKLIEISFLKNIKKNLTPVSVLNEINKELEIIKKEKYILLISEFNSIISDAIKDQPAPFIYERLGERYKDYFIDEFQDTSELQWKNLIPLIDNAMGTESLDGKRGELVIVGDAKQAIYRWRGGKAEQFISLSNDEDPFVTQDKSVINLPRNYRSNAEIIKFNNDFFTFLSQDFSDITHKDIYKEGNCQEINFKENGYVNISLIEAETITEENEVYPQRVLEIILELQEKKYSLSDICILTRRQKEGIAVADYLTENGIAIVSSETLLINNSKEVQFIIDILKLSLKPDDLLLRITILYYLIGAYNIQDKAGFLDKNVKNTVEEFQLYLESLDIIFDLNQLFILPLYESVEYIIRAFKLTQEVSAYIQFFLDVIYDFTQKNAEGIIGFLTYWERKKDKLSIVAPKGKEAVQIMTIHKSKGLEFPCVIYPYANVDIYRELEPKTWYPIEEDVYEGFDEVFINYSKSIAEYGVIGERLVQLRQSQLELDAINVLYVALTRAEEQLYIISKLDLNAKGESNTNKFSGKFINYLKYKGIWEEDVREYSFGNKEIINKNRIESENKETLTLESFINTPKEKHNVNIITNTGKLWNTTQQVAVEKGILLHDLLAEIKTEKELDFVLCKAHKEGIISETQEKELTKEIYNIINNKELNQYYQDTNQILNERDILSNGKIYRPDRVVIDQNNIATVIDYKTGLYDSYHEEQVYEYGALLEKLGYQMGKRILIYINEDIKIKYI